MNDIESAAPTEVSPQQRWTRRANAAAIRLLLLAVASSYGLQQWDGLLVLHGSVLLDWKISATLLAAAVVVWFAGLPMWRAPEERCTAARTRYAGRAVQVVLVVLGLLTAGWNYLLAFGEASSKHVMVAPSGPGECSILLRATFFAFEPTITWRQYTVPGRWGLAVPAPEVRGDPFSSSGPDGNLLDTGAVPLTPRLLHDRKFCPQRCAKRAKSRHGWRS